MTIESQLESIDTTLKALLVAVQSGNQFSAPSSTSENAAEVVAPTEKKTRAKKEVVPVADAMGLVAGDPSGTLYWASMDNKQVYAQLPGAESPPAGGDFAAVSAVVYSDLKAQFAAKPVAEAVVATEPAPTASEAPAPTAEVSWREAVMPAIQALNRKHGADGVRALISAFGLKPKSAENPSGATVPSLEALARHAEVLAKADALTSEDDLIAL